MNKIIGDKNLPFVAYNQGSLCHIETAGAMLVDVNKEGALMEAMDRKKAMSEMGAAMMAERMITIAGSRLYMNMMDSNEIIDEALIRFDRIFSNIQN